MCVGLGLLVQAPECSDSAWECAQPSAASALVNEAA